MLNIAICIITCNREEFLRSCLQSIPYTYRSNLIVVNDGNPLSNTSRDLINEYGAAYIATGGDKGVGFAKNTAFRKALARNAEHIFTIEDDIIVTSPTAFEAYCTASKVSGIKHLMFGYHGPANKRQNTPAPRQIVEYPTGIKIALNQHCVGAFCYYHISLLQMIGLMDERYKNAWEHVEHSYRAVKAGFLPAYWWWPDVADSSSLVGEQACSEVNSVIRPRADWQNNIKGGAAHFFSQHGVSPVEVRDTPPHKVLDTLKQIYQYPP